MSYHDSGEREAAEATGCLLALVLFLIVGFFRLLGEWLAPTPSGVRVGRRRTSLGPGRTVGIPRHMRDRHLGIVGATGSGKTTLIKNLVLQDMAEGHGIAVIDPKGDLINELLPLVPVHRFDDIILFDPTQREDPIGFNVLETVAEQYRSRTASEVVSIFKKLTPDSWGPRLELLLTYTVQTLLEVQGSTLLDIPDLLLDEEFRDGVMDQVTDPAVHAFWQREYRLFTQAQRVQAAMPILNRIGPFLAYPEVRNIIGQPLSSFRTRDVLEGRILLARLPQGELGEIPSALLGSLLISKLMLDAMARSSQPVASRRLCLLYVDEFQNFVTGAFEKIFAESRSYGLGLTVANQFQEQLGRPLSLAVEKNVAVHLSCYRERGRHRVLYRMPQDAQSRELVLSPFGPPQNGKAELAKQIRYYTRQRYGRPRGVIEDAILRRYRRERAHEFDTTNDPIRHPLRVPEVPFWQERQ